ncbi:MAG: aldehyde dehydrogenase family protein [Gammaproteobacteria bacterium]|nr:aldehyde dehydrogenase family protein [Gammaproteobacteria bacterium]
MNVAEIFKTMSYGPAPEATDKVDQWLQDHQEHSLLLIDGQWVAPSSGDYFDSINPATGVVLGKVAQANAADIDKAVKAARAAQPAWQELSGHQRARYLYALARLMQKHSRRLAVLETLDNGKPIRESRDVDVPLAVRHFYHHAGWAQLMRTELPGQQAVGVVGQIIPWNFPLLMAAWKVAPALAAGNCVVLKPAEFTSLSALMFGELCQEAGIPAGVVNIVTGDGETGAELVKHPDINKVAFTGSTDVGRLIKQQTAGSGKKLTLELGGKSPFIVFDDADLDSAVEGLVESIWFNQGQVCCGCSRLLVQEGIADTLIERIKTRMATLRVGDPLDKGVDMGAIIDPSQRERIDALVKQGVVEGATLWQPEGACPESGCFYPPTLLTDVESSNVVAREEIFGPVLSVLSFRSQQEAIDLANNSRYGLASSVWSENINRALDVAPQLKAGVVWINSANQFDASCGFGGYRESGIGREGGMEGMYEYLKPRDNKPMEQGIPMPQPQASPQGAADAGIDHTAKMYIGGKQARPDSGNSTQVLAVDGRVVGLVGEGNRKDIRNAVEAAYKAEGWSKTSVHNRAQILFYIAENLSYRDEEFARRLIALTGASSEEAKAEVEAAIERLFYYAAWADKYDGSVHQPPIRGVVLAMNEAIGVMGIACPDGSPLLAFISMLAPVIAMGNRAVVIPSQRYPLIATDFYQVLETSDLPAGVVNIVTGERELLSKVLAEHNQVDGLWYHGTAQGSMVVEQVSVGNLKRTWVNHGRARDWMSSEQGEGKQFLREACQVKNIWIPYGDSI